MTDDKKRGIAPRPAAPKPAPPRPAPPPPRASDRNAAVAKVAALVEEEVDVVEDLSIAPPPVAPSIPGNARAVSGAVAFVPPVSAGGPVASVASVASGLPIPARAPAPIAPPVIDHADHALPPLPPPPPRAADADADSRSSRRFPFEINVDIVSEHNFYAGLSLNISEGGLFVATHVEYPVGTRLEIRLLLPGDEEPTSIMTEVRWVRPHNENADGSAGMGLRFVGLTPEVLAKVHRFAENRDPLYYEDD